MDHREGQPYAAWPAHTGVSLAERLMRVEVSLAYMAPRIEAQHQRLQSSVEATGRLSERIASLEREQIVTVATVAKLADVPARLTEIERDAKAKVRAKEERRAYRTDATKLLLSAIPVVIMVLYALGMIGTETVKLLLTSVTALGK